MITETTTLPLVQVFIMWVITYIINVNTIIVKTVNEKTVNIISKE